MPIRPENKARYPKNWKEIRAKVQERALNKCEICGVQNGAHGCRDAEGNFYDQDHEDHDFVMFELDRPPLTIVCTVMHLDHQPENNDMSNLKFGCQRCHNRYDMAFRVANRKKNKQAQSEQIPLTPNAPLGEKVRER